MSNLSMIEGIGDDVLYTIATTICVFIFTAGFLRYLEQRSRHRQLQRRGNAASQADIQDVKNGENSEKQSDSKDSKDRDPADCCAICLDNIQYGIETNCGHEFCGSCFLDMWRHAGGLNPVSCPLCRRRVDVLHDHFTPEERESEEHEVIRSDINVYNRRFSGVPRSTWETVMDLPVLLRRLYEDFMSPQGGIPLRARIRIVAAFTAGVVYLISPLDLIPESVVGVVGLTDDGLVLILVLMYGAAVYRRQYLARYD